MDIKEIAEQVSKRIYVEDGLLLSKFISEKFAEALIESCKSELLKEVGEPVAWKYKKYSGGVYVSEHRWDKDQNLYDEEPLFAFPPSVEAIENKVAEACSKLCGSIAETPGHHGATDCESAIDSGEWRKFVKEM